MPDYNIGAFIKDGRTEFKVSQSELCWWYAMRGGFQESKIADICQKWRFRMAFAKILKFRQRFERLLPKGILDCSDDSAGDSWYGLVLVKRRQAEDAERAKGEGHLWFQHDIKQEQQAHLPDK